MKAYYFDMVDVLEEDKFKKKNIYFTKDLFVPKHYLQKFKNRRIELKDFWLGPGKVYLDQKFPIVNHSLRDHHVRQYLYRGTSLIITILELEEHTDWRKDYTKYVKELDGLAIDYMVVPMINIKHLTSDMIRFFGIQKVPFILIDVEKESDLIEVKWGWLRQMQMSVRIPLATLAGSYSEILLDILRQHDLIIINKELDEFPIQKQILVKTGISPKKGEIRIYSDADFNLYLKGNSGEINPKHLTENIPYISVIKGNVVKLNQTVRDKKGFGSHLKVSIQNHF